METPVICGQLFVDFATKTISVYLVYFFIYFTVHGVFKSYGA